MIEALVVNRLLRWAKWKMRTGVSLGYPSQVTWVRLAPQTTYFRDPGIDADCLLTDRAVNLLPELHKVVIRLEYIEAIPSLDMKARRYGRSRRVYGEDLRAAYTLIGNAIDTLINSRQQEVA